ncbi:MAG: LacI family DNA-binding transcriptional regulator [Anaerolineales bacterium]
MPNLAARALQGGKTRILGIVFPYVYDHIFTDPLIELLLEGIEAECNAHGYNMLLSTPRLNGNGLDVNYLSLVQSGYLDGVVGLEYFPSMSVLEPVRVAEIPAVAIGYHPHPYIVRNDDRSGGALLMAHVLGLGHRHIGIITLPEGSHLSITQRMQGLRDAAAEYGLDFDAWPHCEGDLSSPSGWRCAQALLNAHPHITALVALNDRMALGAIQYLHQTGRDVPRDVTVVGYDDIPMAALFSPPLTTINQQATETGRIATQILLQLIDDDIPAAVTVPTQLVVRGSCAPPRAQVIADV